ncbi:single-stranded DNA-binding protein [Serratia ficaria]|uniref:single-stranded DNA-binding protein n=1 Tax=Serratia ficaria TaxID=61651 RepID=UPI0021843AF9|nr:single-stranded DNA-binding protein [Serratia ficaria]CAI2536032.1 Uncharacterised protein [Serratia ficaria]
MQNNTFVGRLITAPVAAGTDQSFRCNFSIVSNEVRGDNVVLNMVAFAATAKYVANNLLKGDQVAVRFSIKNTEYESEGGTIRGYDFIALEVSYLSAGKERAARQNANPAAPKH